ncbi:MAG: VPLPA-CTERM sorting domain-containing protein [Deltaproteobacteria bacterium]|nr:VPLPA-CTERM sorting domain-containing protein [Deltaproteobacteria bacterium]
MLTSTNAFAVVWGDKDAAYLWFEPTGEVQLTPGEQVGVSVYFHALKNITKFVGFGLNIGFDDSAIGGKELTYVDFEYGPEVLSYLGTDEGVGYLPGEATNSGHEGESLFHAGRYDWSFEGFPVPPGTDLLLYTVNFTFDDGSLDGEDIWVEWHKPYPNESYFDVDVEGVVTYIDELNVQGGTPDFAPVPIPAAVWLLGSGLVGLIGITRKRA